MSQTSILLLAAITIILILGLMFYAWWSQKQAYKQKLYATIKGTSHSAKQTVINEKDQRRSDLANKLQMQNEGKTKRKSVLRDDLNQAGFYDVSIKKFFIGSIISCFTLVLLGFLLKQKIIILLLLGVIGFFGLPKFFLRFKIARRQKKFLEEFSDALESMVRLLKAGMPVGEAIAMVSREFDGPIGEEMTKIYEEQKIGIPMGEACLNAARRMPITEMQMFATGIQIQQQTGSSLSEILLNLAKVIRARFRLRRKIQSLSAEAKASASIIGALPILVGAGLTAVNPEYMEPLFNTLKGKMYLAGAGFWMLCGILIMRQMINFRI
jgi:tight adherence protein B